MILSLSLPVRLIITIIKARKHRLLRLILLLLRMWSSIARRRALDDHISIGGITITKPGTNAGYFNKSRSIIARLNIVGKWTVVALLEDSTREELHSFL